MRPLVLGTIIMLFAAAAVAAEVDDTPDTRMAAAEKYLEAVDYTKLMDGALRAGLQGAPEGQREELFALAKKHFDYERLGKLMLAGMVKNFTTKELNAMAVFYGSPEGQSALAKLPAYWSDVMPVLQAEIQKTIADIRAEFEAKRHSPTGT
jgi:hypothetical protein